MVKKMTNNIPIIIEDCFISNFEYLKDKKKLTLTIESKNKLQYSFVFDDLSFMFQIIQQQSFKKIFKQDSLNIDLTKFDNNFSILVNNNNILAIIKEQEIIPSLNTNDIELKFNLLLAKSSQNIDFNTRTKNKSKI